MGLTPKIFCTRNAISVATFGSVFIKNAWHPSVDLARVVNEPSVNGRAPARRSNLPGETRLLFFAILDWSDAAAEPDVVELDC